MLKSNASASPDRYVYYFFDDVFANRAEGGSETPSMKFARDAAA